MKSKIEVELQSQLKENINTHKNILKMSKNIIDIIQNIVPIEEIFTGSNYKSYKHKYYIAYIPHKHSENLANYEITEVSKMEWKTFDECISIMRPYNLEKKRLLTNIHNTLTQYYMMYM